jgi:hypothetical protein
MIEKCIDGTDYDDLVEYLKHDSWRCDYYQDCHCGLNYLTDKLNLPRVPYEGKFPGKTLAATSKIENVPK